MTKLSQLLHTAQMAMQRAADEMQQIEHDDNVNLHGHEMASAAAMVGKWLGEIDDSNE